MTVPFHSTRTPLNLRHSSVEMFCISAEEICVKFLCSIISKWFILYRGNESFPGLVNLFWHIKNLELLHY